MVANVETITPEIAEAYMERNKINRSVSNHTVAKYANDMSNGMWQINGEPIVFDVNGNLKDGQHRLLAVIRAGVPVSMLVVRGVSEDVSIFNIGRGRSITDAITISNELDKDIVNSCNVAIARLHARMQKHQSNVSVHDVQEFLKEHSEALKMMAPIRKKGHESGVTIKSTIFMLPIMYAIEAGDDYEKVKEFADVLSSGFYQRESQTAAVVLRNDVLLGKIKIQGGGSDRAKACICVENAINDFCRGKVRKKTYANSTTPIYSNCVKETSQSNGK